MQKLNLFAATCALGLSLTAAAADFSTADALYAKRDEGRSSALKAREAYEQIVAQGAKDTDLVRAVEGVARTYLYEGGYLLSIDKADEKAERKKVFHDCWTVAVENMSPAKLGFSSPAYWYLRASCIAQEAQVSSVLERLANLPKLNDALDKGLAAPGGDTYEGGGLLRVKAAVKGNPEAKGLPGGLYNPEEALKLIDRAIAAGAYPGSVEGFLFCENFRRKVDILNTLGRGAESKALAASTVSDFGTYLEQGLIPESIRAETVGCIKEVKKAL